MHTIDLVILVSYMVAMVGIGAHFYRRNSHAEDYYVGGRNIGPYHIGFSVVATDVGGGFSVGLGGLGFSMGISGSWLLFTGLLGAWLSAVVLIPRVKALESEKNFFTFPDVFHHHFGPRAAAIAALVSAVGYTGFTSSQILAGAKLASATIAFDKTTALWLMGGLAVLYTAIGGLKAVVYTDSIQWAVLMVGLIGVALPISYSTIGGWEGLRAAVPPQHLNLWALSPVQWLNWAVTIIPIWFVAMTLYQRMYASRSVADAQKAWFLAGLLEWPLMAFMGALLGLFARAAAEQGLLAEALGATALVDPEMGLPLLLKTVLPAGMLGLVLASYFSAILSTADSCLLAASGNVTADILGPLRQWSRDSPRLLIASQGVTLALGLVALGIASQMPNVLGLMLHSYAFMVSGLLVPVIAAFFWKRKSQAGAIASMLLGGSANVALALGSVDLPLGLDPAFFGIGVSWLAYWGVGALSDRTAGSPVG